MVSTVGPIKKQTVLTVEYILRNKKLVKVSTNSHFFFFCYFRRRLASSEPEKENADELDEEEEEDRSVVYYCRSSGKCISSYLALASSL